MSILYFTQDVTDSLTTKRISMLSASGESVRCFGMMRTTNTVATPPAEATVLAAGNNAKLLSRPIAIGIGLIRLLMWHRRAVAGATLMMARNLDIAALAILARVLSGGKASLYYECLDVHRKLTSKTIGGAILRFLEATILRRCAGIIVSSPAFVEGYFDAIHAYHGRIAVLENKVWTGPVNTDQITTPRKRARRHEQEANWVIGYVGLLRCRKSIMQLRELLESRPDLELHLHGVPDPNLIPDFDQLIAGVPRVSYFGRFNNPDDLPRIYAGLDFCWLGDFTAAGANSEWLLPNRLYEGCLFGSVPIAIDGTETARWLSRHGIGVNIGREVKPSLDAFFRALDEPRYESLMSAVCSAPTALFQAPIEEVQALIRWMREGAQGRRSFAAAGSR